MPSELSCNRFQDKRAGFVFFEAETKATSKRVETRGGQGLAWLGKDQGLEFEDFSGLFSTSM